MPSCRILHDLEGSGGFCVFNRESYWSHLGENREQIRAYKYIYATPCFSKPDPSELEMFACNGKKKLVLNRVLGSFQIGT